MGLSLALAGWVVGHWLWPRAVPTKAAEAGAEIQENAGAESGTGTEWSGPELSPDERAIGLSEEGIRKVLADPVTSGRSLKNDKNSRQRVALMASRLALTSPDAMRSFLDAAFSENPSQQKRLAMSEAVQWAFHRTPEAGLAALDVMPDSIQKVAAVRRMFRFLPPRLIVRVLPWYEKQPPGPTPKAALEGMLPALARHDFALALRLVSASDEGGEPEQKWAARVALIRHATAFPADPLKGLEQSLLSFPPEERASLRFSFKLDQARSWMEGAPGEASAFLLELIHEDPLRSEESGVRKSVEELFLKWGAYEPLSALEQLASWPEELRPSPFCRQFFQTCTEANEAVVSQWVRDQPPGPLRELAVEGLALGLAGDDAVAALRWAATLVDNRLRRQILQAVLTKAGPGSEDALERVLAHLPLAPGDRDQLVIPPSAK